MKRKKTKQKKIKAWLLLDPLGKPASVHFTKKKPHFVFEDMTGQQTVSCEITYTKQ